VSEPAAKAGTWPSRPSTLVSPVRLRGPSWAFDKFSRGMGRLPLALLALLPLLARVAPLTPRSTQSTLTPCAALTLPPSRSFRVPGAPRPLRHVPRGCPVSSVTTVCHQRALASAGATRRWHGRHLRVLARAPERSASVAIFFLTASTGRAAASNVQYPIDESTAASFRATSCKPETVAGTSDALSRRMEPQSPLARSRLIREVSRDLVGMAKAHIASSQHRLDRARNLIQVVWLLRAVQRRRRQRGGE
jgi:hypothetical protein